jgi:glycerophosphoryl diester phosphodiesterase
MPRLPSFPHPSVLAHRMLVPGFPENTIMSLKEAIKLGVDWIEFDVKVLTDGTIVSLHDGTVDRTTDGTGDITRMDYEQVRKLNAGKGYSFGFVPVPRVEEILAELSTCGKFIRAEMHIHNLWEPEPLVALLDKYRVRDRCYFNLNAMMMGIYMREDLHDTTSLLSLNAQGESPEMKDLCNQYDLAYLCVPHKMLTASYVDHIHAYRRKNPVFVHCYPVQNEPDWKQMVDIGVDVIQTDFPDGLASYISEYST